MSTFRLNDDSVTPPVSEETKDDVKEISSNNGDQHSVEEKTEGVKEIVLKGPLSHAYTEALNILLDKNENKTQDIRQESISMALHAMNIVDDNEEEMKGSIPDSGRAFIYVHDGKKMGLSDVSNMYEEMANTKEGHPEAGFVGGVIENAEHMLEKPVLAKNLETMSLSLESMKIPLFFSRAVCMNAALNFMRKKKA